MNIYQQKKGGGPMSREFKDVLSIHEHPFLSIGQSWGSG